VGADVNPNPGPVAVCILEKRLLVFFSDSAFENCTSTGASNAGFTLNVIVSSGSTLPISTSARPTPEGPELPIKLFCCCGYELEEEEEEELEEEPPCPPRILPEFANIPKPSASDESEISTTFPMSLDMEKSGPIPPATFSIS